MEALSKLMVISLGIALIQQTVTTEERMAGILNGLR